MTENEVKRALEKLKLNSEFIAFAAPDPLQFYNSDLIATITTDANASLDDFERAIWKVMASSAHGRTGAFMIVADPQSGIFTADIEIAEKLPWVFGVDCVEPTPDAPAPDREPPSERPRRETTFQRMRSQDKHIRKVRRK